MNNYGSIHPSGLFALITWLDCDRKFSVSSRFLSKIDCVYKLVSHKILDYNRHYRHILLTQPGTKTDVLIYHKDKHCVRKH